MLFSQLELTKTTRGSVGAKLEPLEFLQIRRKSIYRGLAQNALYAYGTYGSAAYSSRWSGNTLANGQLLFGRACYCVEGGLTMFRGCWTRYGDTSFGGVLGTGVPL